MSFEFRFSRFFSPAVVIILLLFNSCSEESNEEPNQVNWEKRSFTTPITSQTEKGETYLSVYSEIYSMSQHRTHHLTVTISMRNMNRKDTIVLDKAEYFDSKGELLKCYFDFPVMLIPMETLEIVLEQDDVKGGSGGNFMFNWRKEENAVDPYFEAVMISTASQQGLSFISEGIKIK
ncbi:MAG: DUF3124 domain-containing protein [Crocinitomicaceae bacterium]|nr:DUF3124 domain-containing protein [Crocinitomicaceae bacterium]